MSNSEDREVIIEKEKTKRELINAWFWLIFWFLIIGGCTADLYISYLVSK